MALGFVAACLAVWLAEPTAASVWWGGGVAAVGELIRVWAAGHLEKSREVTTSGPYRFTRHPLYVGSTVMGIGLAIASRSVWVAALVLAYLASTLSAAIRREESFLRQRFGDAYDEYAAGQRWAEATRRFSLARAMRNREYRAVLGLAAVIVLMVWKASFR